LTFSKAPFVFITGLFISGILFWDSLSLSFESALTTLFVALLIYLALSEVNYTTILKSRIVFLFIAIISTGGVVVALNRTTSKTITEGTSVLLSVEEIALTDKDWRKSICRVNSLLIDNSVEQHDEKILLFFNSSQIQEGDVLLVQTNLKNIENRNNPGEFNVKAYWNNKNIYKIGFVGEDDFKLIRTVDYPWWVKWNTNVRSYLTEKLKIALDGESLGVAVALLLGDKQLLTNEVRSSFSNAGAMHVLAVSGLHVGIVLVILMFILGRFTRFISKKNAILISIAIIWFYAGITGFSPSVLRASFMFSLLAIAQISSRSNNPINILFFSAFVLLLMEPLWIYDIGFQLSYLAMCGIYILYTPLSKLIYVRNKLVRKVWQVTAVGLSAQLLTVPLTLYYFHQFPNYFVLTNIGMMVFSGLLLGIGLFFFSLSWSTILSFIVGHILKIGLIAMIFFVQLIDNIPFSVATGFQLSVLLLVVIYLLIVVYLFPASSKLKKGLISSFIFIFLLVHFQRYQNMRVCEMVVFNSDDFALVMKNEDQIICFHNAKEERVRSIKSIVKDYNLIRPGNVSFVFLEDGLTKAELKNDKVEIYTDKYGVNIISSKVQLHVRTNYSGNFFELDNSFDMAYLAKNKDRYNLAEGAKVIPLE